MGRFTSRVPGVPVVPARGEEVMAVRAAVGDRIVVRGTRVGAHEHTGVVLAVRGDDGAPPYLVRWDDGQEGLVFPGPDAVVEHFPVVEQPG